MSEVRINLKSSTDQKMAEKLTSDVPYVADDALLKVRNLRTSFRISGKYYAAVDGVSLDIRKNEVTAIVGESGCGKSAMALSFVKLHNPLFTRMSGEVIFDGKNMIDMSENQLNKYRGRHISMIFQDPLTALNPLLRVGPQIEESLTYHTNLNDSQRKARVMELLEEVGMTNPELTYKQLPHMLSGGMRQRAMIAVALACKPDVIIADEPTTALDVTIQAQILDLLRGLQKEMQAAVVLITHDLGVVAEMADRVAVMYAGQIVEIGTSRDIFKNPQHPYTRSLFASMPSVGGDDRLHSIHGIVPPLQYLPRTGCRFSSRTPWVSPHIHEEDPQYYKIADEHYVLCSCYKDFNFDGEADFLARLHAGAKGGQM
jgi:peptide/nickel transport system ATP-binding protein